MPNAESATFRRANTPGQVLFASMIGTAVEFFDFYIYATAAVLVFPKLFFPNSSPATATLESLATFAIAFVARPIGSVLFGHFGDRIGRKATLVAALLTMGLSTVAIGLLPTYDAIGVAAPAMLALCRFGQGIGLGGEWGGAVLLATENAPPGRRAWYGTFPQLGAPIGFVFSGSVFLLLSRSLSDAQFFSWGWRVPFLASAVLVLIGLYVRLSITETPVFAAALRSHAPVKVPVVEVLRRHAGAVVLGVMVSLIAFMLFYIMSVFTLSWGTSALGYTRPQFLLIQLFGILFFAACILVSGHLAERGRRRAMIWMVSGAIVYGFAFAPMFSAGTAGAIITVALGFAFTGLVYGPLGTVLSELFPTAVRYSGSSIAFNVAGIFGASLTPYAATWLAHHHGLRYVGYYIAAIAALSLVGVLASRETSTVDITK